MDLDDFYAAINSPKSQDSTRKFAVNSAKTTVNFQFYSLTDGHPPSMQVCLIS